MIAFFVDILFSTEEEYLKRRRVVKYLRNFSFNSRVLPYFSHGAETRKLQLYYTVILQILCGEFIDIQKIIYSSSW